MMVLSACQMPEVNTSSAVASPSGPPSVVALSPAVLTSSPTASIPSPTGSAPTSAAIGGTAAVLVKGCDTVALPMSMSVAAFHKKTAALGWSCSPRIGTDKYGNVKVGLNQFNFIDGGLYRVGVGDPEFSTEKGLRIGDSMATMKRIYGEPDGKFVWPDNGGVEYGYTLSETLSIGVTFKAGKIVGMDFG